MATLVNALQPRKAAYAMRVTEAGMATLVNELQPLKASLPMLVTDVGMATRINEVHPRKANRSMLIIDVGIVTLVTSSLFTPHSAQESCPSPFHGYGCVILVVPSGIAKCTPPSGGAAAVVAILLGHVHVRTFAALSSSPVCIHANPKCESTQQNGCMADARLIDRPLYIRCTLE